MAYVRAKNERGFFSVRDYVRDPRRFMAGLETLAMADYSLCIKVSSVCGKEREIQRAEKNQQHSPTCLLLSS